MPFEPGKSGNPEGRPRNVPNKTTLALRQRIEDEADPIGFLIRVMRGEAIERAARVHEGPEQVIPTLEQSLSAARILTAKLAPDARDRPVPFDLGDVDGPAAALKACGQVMVSMGRGEITPAEALGVMSAVSGYVEAWKADELEARLLALEERQDA